MAGKTVVKCPGCKSQLGLGMSQQELSGKKIRCPKCSKTFVVKLPAATKPTAEPETKQAATQPTVRSKPTSSPSAKKGAAPTTKKPVARTASSKSPQKVAAAERKAAPAVKKKRKKKRVEPEPLETLEEYDDDAVEFFDDDSYGDDLYGDEYADDFGDSADDYGSSPAPKRKKKKKSSGKSKKKAKSEAGASPNHGFLGWLGFGAGAAAACAVATMLIGMTGIWFLVVIMAIVTGSVVGGAVRYSAGYNLGWGPGLVAVVMAFASILVGRVVVIATDPNSIANITERHSPEKIAEEIDRYSSDGAMISDIASDIQSDEEWLQENNVTESMLENHWEEFDYDDPFEMHHLPVIWEEAKRRWDEKPEDDRARLIEQTRSDMRSEYGIMTPEEVDALIAEETTDESMIAYTAEFEVEDDEEWLTGAGVTDEAIQTQWAKFDGENRKDRFVPAVWEEATSRWNALPDDQKEQQRQERADELRIENGADEEANAESEQALGLIRWVLLFVSAIGTMILPLWPLFCTGSGLTAAFKIGSGMASQ